MKYFNSKTISGTTIAAIQPKVEEELKKIGGDLKKHTY